MRDGSPGHVNVLIHWGVYGNSTFRLHARGLETRPLETDPPGEREIERGRGKHFESDGDALRTAECHYAYCCGGGHSTPNLFPICIRARCRRSVLQAAACRRGHGRNRIRSRARFHPQVPVPERVPLSSPRVYTSRRWAIGKMPWIYLRILCLDDILMIYR